jgi:hypothetical protein
MIQFILMLLGLAFGNHNGNTTSCNNNNQNQVTTLDDEPGDPGTGIDPGTGTGGEGGPVGGNTGQLPPPFTNP